MEICKTGTCTGCGLCCVVCPKKAVTMKMDIRGFLYPDIDRYSCINCKKCNERCPNNHDLPEFWPEQKVYAAWNRESESRKRSSSGGIFSKLAEFILDMNGVVFGVKWNNEFHAEHCAITSKEELYLLNSSKYMQSITGDIYEQVVSALSKEKQVLFSGTPCQVAALNQYIGKKNSNLFTVDLVCHGVPSSQAFDRHLNELTNSNLAKVKSVNLRYKSPCWNYGSVRIDYKDESFYMKPTVEDAYFNLFNFNYSLRKCCHICKYTNRKRIGDITLADYWGYIPNSMKMRNFDKGVSCILINSEKGNYFFNQVRESLVCEKSSLEQAIHGNQCLDRPFPAPDDCEMFWKNYENKMSINELNKKYIRNPYKVPRFLKLRLIKQRYFSPIKRMLRSGK